MFSLHKKEKKLGVGGGGGKGGRGGGAWGEGKMMKHQCGLLKNLCDANKYL